MLRCEIDDKVGTKSNGGAVVTGDVRITVIPVSQFLYNAFFLFLKAMLVVITVRTLNESINFQFPKTISDK